MKAAIVGISGTALTEAEDALIRRYPPAGVILFSRNVVDPRQLRHLAADLKRILPAGAVLMVDQEGGRVARLRPPHWSAHPPAGELGARFQTRPEQALRAAWLTGAMIGAECAAAGFDVVAAPVLDRRIPGASNAIGDRAFSEDPVAVARLGRAVADGLMAAGVLPVMKHLPGHGAAELDSHFGLPVVAGTDRESDLAPFALNADFPWAMTAHICYPAWDAARPATLSPEIIGRIIRGRIGFKGVLVSDDLAMHALTGSPSERALGTLAAGCDLALYCPGDLAGSEEVLEACPELALEIADRIAHVRDALRHDRADLHVEQLSVERDQLLA